MHVIPKNRLLDKYRERKNTSRAQLKALQARVIEKALLEVDSNARADVAHVERNVVLLVDCLLRHEQAARITKSESTVWFERVRMVLGLVSEPTEVVKGVLQRGVAYPSRRQLMQYKALVNMDEILGVSPTSTAQSSPARPS